MAKTRREDCRFIIAWMKEYVKTLQEARDHKGLAIKEGKLLYG